MDSNASFVAAFVAICIKVFIFFIAVQAIGRFLMSPEGIAILVIAATLLIIGAAWFFITKPWMPERPPRKPVWQ